MSKGIARKGARSRSEVPPDIVEALSKGTLSAQNLVEAMTVDFDLLIDHVFRVPKPLAPLMSLPYTQRMKESARLIFDRDGEAAIQQCLVSPSDTVGGIGAFIVRLQFTGSTQSLLETIRPFAADEHFAVREWAWLAVRPEIVERPLEFIDQLTPWALSPDPFIRRFASEATRPRGVWCAHIRELAQSPSIALAILDPLQSDPEKYVQDSVANWLNDASKTNPEWVKVTCQRWLHKSQSAATRRIVQRAQRSMKD